MSEPLTAGRFREIAETSGDRREFRPGTDLWNAFHRAWTSAVGQPGYDKAVWLAMEAALAERDALMEILVGRWPTGEHLARIPHDLGGHVGGTWSNDHRGYFFADRESALAAVRAAAGIGPGEGS